MRVEWVINTGVDIREGAGADIALETLLGSKFIRITNAATGDELMADLPRSERKIPHRDCTGEGICEERTHTPYDVFDLTRAGHGADRRRPTTRPSTSSSTSWPTSPRASGRR